MYTFKLLKIMQIYMLYAPGLIPTNNRVFSSRVYSLLILCCFILLLFLFLLSLSPAALRLLVLYMKFYVKRCEHFFGVDAVDSEKRWQPTTAKSSNNIPVAAAAAAAAPQDKQSRANRNSMRGLQVARDAKNKYVCVIWRLHIGSIKCISQMQMKNRQSGKKYKIKHFNN